MKSDKTMEDFLVKWIGRDVRVNYCYKGYHEGYGRGYDVGYDRGILKEVGNGYIFLERSNSDSYNKHISDTLRAVNLANVTNVELYEKIDEQK